MEIKEKILVIDDDAAVVEVICDALNKAEFETLSALNGEEGFELFNDKQPDVVIIDALMPKLNGFELAAQIRRTDHGNQVPIIMISGIYKALRMHDQIRDLDINDFLEKPLKMREMVQRIKQLLLVSQEKDPQAEFLEERGKLNDIPFARLLYLLFIKRENGVLLVAKSKLKKKLYIQNGEPRFVESNLVQECLGKLLVRKGRLTQEQVDESLRLMQTKKKRQGEMLIKMGAITANELDEALKDQARDKILDIFTWDSGSYQFKPTSEKKSGLTPIDIALPQILLRGVRNGISIEFLKKKMDDYLDQKVEVKDNPHLKFEEFRLATWDERILHEIDGQRTLRALLNSKAAREADIYQLLYTFVITNMIDFVENEEERKEKDTIKKLTLHLEELKTKDHFEMLGVRRTTSSDEIFQALSKHLHKYHPVTSEFNTSKSPHISEVLNKITQTLIKAHDTLTNDSRRRHYERQLYLEKGIRPTNPDKIFDADTEFRKLKIDVEKGDYDKTAPKLRSMAKLFVKDWRFKAYYGWAQFKLMCREKKQTKESLHSVMTDVAAAVKIAPNEPTGYLFLGFMYKYLDDYDTAESFFKKAIEHDPNCIEAERELRLILMRKSKANKSFIKWK